MRVFFFIVQMNDGPLCRCNVKSCNSGIRHDIYPGENVSILVYIVFMYEYGLILSEFDLISRNYGCLGNQVP